MNWIELTTAEQLEQIKEASKNAPVLIFKHSTACSTSNMVINRLERSWKEEEMKTMPTYYLDLLSYRQISNAIAEQFNVRHESPQVLIIRDGKMIYNGSHFEINYPSLQQVIQE